MDIVSRTPDEVKAEAARFVREAWGLQGAAYIVVILRYFSRIRQLGWRKLALDDFFMFGALVGLSFPPLFIFQFVIRLTPTHSSPTQPKRPSPTSS